MDTNPNRQDPLIDVDQSILKAHRIVQGLAVCALLVYVIWFWLVKQQPLSINSDTWGAFGDFLGGVLNPVIAYSAFYWLTQSVRLQKRELSETRLALQESATHARMSVRLDALTALTNSIASDISSIRFERQFVAEQVALNPSKGGARTIEGDWLHKTEWESYLTEKNALISKRLGDQKNIENEIKILLHQYAQYDAIPLPAPHHRPPPGVGG